MAGAVLCGNLGLGSSSSGKAGYGAFRYVMVNRVALRLGMVRQARWGLVRCVLLGPVGVR